jgi:phage-related protein
MRNYFIFGDVDSRDYGVYINGTGTFDAPTRAYEAIEVPGRDGALLGLEHRFENIELTYPAFVYDAFSNNMTNLRSALLSKIGYQELTDTYHPDEFRKAVYKGGLSADVVPGNHAGQFDLVFECMPQRWLISGSTAVEMTSASTLNNPTEFDSMPLIRAYGSGTIGINGMTVTIASHSNPYIDIDCEMMDCFYNAVNCNSLVSFSGNDFPTLRPGTNNFTLSGVTKIVVTPRWWRV